MVGTLIPLFLWFTMRVTTHKYKIYSNIYRERERDIKNAFFLMVFFETITSDEWNSSASLCWKLGRHQNLYSSATGKLPPFLEIWTDVKHKDPERNVPRTNFSFQLHRNPQENDVHEHPSSNKFKQNQLKIVSLLVAYNILQPSLTSWTIWSHGSAGLSPLRLGRSWSSCWPGRSAERHNDHEDDEDKDDDKINQRPV